MGRLLFLIFLIVPIIEIGIFILIGQAIGLWPTLAGVVLTALIGSFIIRLQGLSLINEIQRLIGVGMLPARQLADGVMIAIAGALLLTPGYFTDLLGFTLLVPFIRDLVYQGIKSRISIVSGFSDETNNNKGGDFSGENNPFGSPPHRSNRPKDPDIVDLEDEDWR